LNEPQPWSWSVTDHEARWDGYFIRPGSDVLRNKVGALTIAELASAENDLFEFRLAELRERPSIVERTWDLAHLRSLHQHLFQDIYEWAGDLRTVGIAKGGGESFAPPLSIDRPINYVAGQIQEKALLTSLTDVSLVTVLTDLYDYANFAHPFREGNGRTQREFFNQLMAESGRGLNWSLIEMDTLHTACHVARTDANVGPLREIFEVIVSDDPAY